MIETTSITNNLECKPKRNRESLSGGRAAMRLLRPAPVFAVTSGKGGVGKTNVTANLAANFYESEGLA